MGTGAGNGIRDCHTYNLWVTDLTNYAITTYAGPASATVGTAVTVGDSATFVNASASNPPSGSVTFTLYSDAACTTPVGGVVSGSGTISGNSASWSTNWIPSAAGTYYWQASYPGDTYNPAYTTVCNTGSEEIVVNPSGPTLSNPTIATTLSATSILAGHAVHDSAALSGATGNAGGSVTYTIYTDNLCSLNPQPAGTVTVTNGSVPDSNVITLNTAGTYYWQAFYSGDSSNQGVTSNCNEQLTVNPAPVAVDDSASTAINTAVTTSVLTNDNLGVPPTAISANTQGTNGSVVCTATQCTYTPNSGFTGTDSYKYTIKDSNGNTSTATVNLTVMPKAVDDGPYSVPFNTTSTGGGANILTNDLGTSLTVASVTGMSTCTVFPCTINTAHGSVMVASDGTFSYSPTVGYYGSDSFTYVASDGTGQTNSATVSFNVQKPAAPVAVNDSGTTVVNTALDSTTPGAGQSVNNASILTNDTGTGIALTSVTGGGAACTVFPCSINTTHGSMVVALSGTYVYTPASSYRGTDSFDYQITDVASQTASATVNLTVLKPSIQVDKTISSVTFDSPSVLDIVYDIQVTNNGAVDLGNIQITDDLTTAYPLPASFTIVSTKASNLKVNPAYNGSTNTNLLTGADTLAVGSSGTIKLEVKVDMGGKPTTFTNTATASGTPPAGPSVTASSSVTTAGFADPAVAKTAKSL